jgi:sensor histidine kinase regulating citrate/malate metabolism
MFENAIEACRLMEYGAMQIRLQSKISGDMLVFGMNNSFDGEVRRLSDGDYFSRKRESGVATGLKSIRSVAEKYGGSVKFEAVDRVFKTSVRLDMASEQ